MRRLLLVAALGASACTTVVQEPADLAPAKVESLIVTAEGGAGVRLRSPAAWGEPGEIFHVTNRLTGTRTEVAVDDAGTLDLELTGSVHDVFAVSRFADAPHAPQFTTREGATLHAWGFGFGGLDGCDADDFAAGAIEHGPAHEHESCFAAAEPAPLLPDHDVPAVGISALGPLVLHDAPLVRFQANAHTGGDVRVRVATTSGTYEGTHTVDGPDWQTRSLQASELLHDGAPLAPGLEVTALWISAEGHAPADGLAVDDVVIESASFAE